MPAGERYFMASVDMITAKARIERMLADLKENDLPPSVDLIAACISDLSSAMCKVSRDRLSDPRYKIVPGCSGGCGRDGLLAWCGNSECT